MNKTTNAIRLIEFVFCSPLKDENDKIIPMTGIFQIDDIVGIVQEDKQFCTLSLHSGKSHKLYGTYRALTNRYIYALEKPREFYHDQLIRPSIAIYHNDFVHLEPNDAFLDEFQIKAFVQALRPELFNKFELTDNFTQP
jgi:hypothetical protein